MSGPHRELVERLKEALEPFAAKAASIEQRDKTWHKDRTADSYTVAVRLGYCRKAAEALAIQPTDTQPCPKCGASAVIEGKHVFCSNPGCPDPPTDTVLAEPQEHGEWPQFNLNREVAVKLTDDGLRIMEDHHNELNNLVPLGPFKPPKTDAEGWSKFQLWALMQEFGQHICMGRPLPFETTIRLDANAITAQERL